MANPLPAQSDVNSDKGALAALSGLLNEAEATRDAYREALEVIAGGGPYPISGRLAQSIAKAALDA